MCKINIFVANTPFHLYIIEKIIIQYYSLSRNIIISTVRVSEKKIINAEVIHIKSFFSTLITIDKIKKIILSSPDICLHFPHLNNFYSSAFYNLAQGTKCRIAIYYEGIALLYPSKIKNSFTTLCKRYIFSILLNLKYVNYEVLHPKEICLNSICISPFIPENSHFLDFKIVDLSVKYNNIRNSNHNILLITSWSMEIEVIQNLITLLEKNIDEQTLTLYIKPHYMLKKKGLKYLLESIRKVYNGNIVCLEKRVPIEELVESLDFNLVISQHFSSSLLHLKEICGDNVKFEIVQNIKNPILLQLAVKYKIINGNF